MLSVPSMHLCQATDATPSPPRALATAMGEMHTLARGHADNATSPHMLAGGHVAINASASMLRHWTGVALPTLPSFEAIQTIGLTAISTMLVRIMILVFVAIFGITTTTPPRANLNTKAHSISIEVKSASQSSLANDVIQIADNVVRNGASVLGAAGNTDLPVEGVTPVVAAMWADAPPPSSPSPQRISRFSNACPPIGFMSFPCLFSPETILHVSKYFGRKSQIIWVAR
ncbi:Aste57867_18228 [Aphanomyces stellatus]|uniref:Aste57867_18228 protein n=1 Tax=Aphanomyces stellatus TaxID=120398 RepID=A0A485LB57_9STRA|nr:hypothetical protein As57867_018166 [Aphanomyces stellatus]VFT94966.1 Aste57867_18228 [Aphanomyces stellatus]